MRVWKSGLKTASQSLLCLPCGVSCCGHARHQHPLPSPPSPHSLPIPGTKYDYNQLFAKGVHAEVRRRPNKRGGEQQRSTSLARDQGSKVSSAGTEYVNAGGIMLSVRAKRRPRNPGRDNLPAPPPPVQQSLLPPPAPVPVRRLAVAAGVPVPCPSPQERRAQAIASKVAEITRGKPFARGAGYRRVLPETRRGRQPGRSRRFQFFTPMMTIPENSF